jgi:competence protein ComEC
MNTTEPFACAEIAFPCARTFPFTEHLHALGFRSLPVSLRQRRTSERKETQTHYVCVRLCGFNIALIAGYLTQIGKRLFAFKPPLADWFVILALIVYTLLVGASASVVRAAIMGSLTVIAIHYQRQALALNSLAAAALIMTLLNPFTLWDVGFQLSLLATLGLLLYTQPLTAWAERALARTTDSARAKRVISFLGESLIVTLAAWFTTTPLIVATFHRLSIIGLLTNVLVLPVQPGIPQPLLG